MTEQQDARPDLDKLLLAIDLEKPALDPGANDERAKREAHAFANKIDLEADGKRREHSRHQSFREHINRAAIILFWGLVLFILWGMAAVAWHSLMPENWHYLIEKQLESVKTFLTTALFSSALTGYVNKRMG